MFPFCYNYYLPDEVEHKHTFMFIIGCILTNYHHHFITSDFNIRACSLTLVLYSSPSLCLSTNHWHVFRHLKLSFTCPRVLYKRDNLRI